MSAWLLAAVVLLPALAMPAYVGLTGSTTQRFVAVQLATTVTAFILVLLSFAFDQPSFMDLPLTLAVLTLPGTLFFAMFLERWL